MEAESASCFRGSVRNNSLHPFRNGVMAEWVSQIQSKGELGFFENLDSVRCHSANLPCSRSPLPYRIPLEIGLLIPSGLVAHRIVEHQF